MLNKEQTEEIRSQIEAELGALSQTLSGATKDSMELDQTRVGRLSRMDAMQQQAMASGMRERLLLRKRRLEAALTRADQETLGICCQCAEAIPIERLSADFGTPFCATCQEEIDDRNSEDKRRAP